MTTKYFTGEPALNINAANPSDNSSLTLAYRTYGSPDMPGVMMSTCYSGVLDNTLTFLYTPGAGGEQQAPPLASYFVIVCGLIGAGESSSPSNAAPAARGASFPRTNYEDNVRLQHALCRAMGVERLAAYIGFSMGGQQAYHMAAIFPDFVDRVVVIAGSARTSWHNWSFLEGTKAALLAAEDWRVGEYGSRPAARGTRAFARLYSTSALSHAWFRGRCWESLGFGSLDEYVAQVWERSMGAKDVHDLLCMLHTWQIGDISLHGPEEGNLPAALARIKARVLVMPSRTDCLFPPEDSEEEVKHLSNGELRVIESIWGHLAGGGGGSKEDTAFISRQVARFLSQ